MGFDEWYNKTFPETVGKHDVINIACRSAAFFGWEASEKEARKGYEKVTALKEVNCPDCLNRIYFAKKEILKGYVKLEDVERILRRHTPKLCGYRGQIVTEEEALIVRLNSLKKEIKQLANKEGKE